MSKDLKIELHPNMVPRLRSLGMNWAAQAQKPFMFKPVSFTAMIEGLKPKTFTQAKQVKMLQQFLADPTVPGIIGISSAPNDGMSKLMAAYLMQVHLQAHPDHRPKWQDVTGGFNSDLMDPEPANVSMLVLNNIGPDSSQTKKEKLRDILERYADLPIVAVVNGSDAFTFFTRDMRKPISGVLYLTNALVRKAHEV